MFVRLTELNELSEKAVLMAQVSEWCVSSVKSGRRRVLSTMANIGESADF